MKSKVQMKIKMSRNKLIFLACLVTLSIVSCGIIYYLWKKGRKERYTNGAEFFFRVRDTLDYHADTLPLNQAMTDAIVQAPTFSASDSYQKATFLLFETLNTIDSLMDKMSVKKEFPPYVKWIYGIKGTDFMASKSSLNFFFRKMNGSQIEQKYLPKTFILSQDQDVRDMTQEVPRMNGQALYIMKKNIQRQEGYYLASSITDIRNKYKQDKEFVVVQEILQDPYLVNGRKINLRIYMMIMVIGKEMRMFIHENGFLYYTPKPFVKMSMNPEEIITTGYIDRNIYKDNPLSLDDLRQFIGVETFGRMFTNIKGMMKHLKSAYQELFIRHNESIPGTKFLVYGCDVAPNENLDVKLMEVNKGPDMSYKDDRDKEVKLNMMTDVFEKVDIIDTSSDTDGDIEAPRPPKRINRLVEIV